MRSKGQSVGGYQSGSASSTGTDVRRYAQAPFDTHMVCRRRRSVSRPTAPSFLIWVWGWSDDVSTTPFPEFWVLPWPSGTPYKVLTTLARAAPAAASFDWLPDGRRILVLVVGRANDGDAPVDCRRRDWRGHAADLDAGQREPSGGFARWTASRVRGRSRRFRSGRIPWMGRPVAGCWRRPGTNSMRRSWPTAASTPMSPTRADCCRYGCAAATGVRAPDRRTKPISRQSDAGAGIAGPVAEGGPDCLSAVRGTDRLSDLGLDRRRRGSACAADIRDRSTRMRRRGRPMAA